MEFMDTKAYDKNREDGSQADTTDIRVHPSLQPPQYQQYDGQAQMQPAMYQGVTGVQPILTAPTTSHQQPLSVANTMVFEPTSRHFACPNCQASGPTTVRREIGLKNHFLALILCCSGICTCCCWAAYLLNQAKDSNHYCGTCGSLIGKEAIAAYHHRPYHGSGVILAV